MKLKPAILSVLSRNDLKSIIDRLEVDGVDRRSVEAMRAALRKARRATPDALLAQLKGVKGSGSKGIGSEWH